MITYTDGDIFESGADVLVNPVNCQGASGAGLALEFKKRFPQNAEFFRRLCIRYDVPPGAVVMFRESANKPFSIANLTTKDSWRHPSRLEWIGTGLAALAIKLEQANMKSVALPALGCGLGGLQWSDVKSIIDEVFKDSELEVKVYAPK